jgi:hypothetical protein
MRRCISTLTGIILYFVFPIYLSCASTADIPNTDEKEFLLRFDPYWKQKSDRLYIEEKDGSISMQVAGNRLIFPPVLTSEFPIVIRTKHGFVKQFLQEDGTYKAELAGRYLIYRGKRKSILYCYDSLKREIREFVYLSEKNSMDAGDSVIRWRFEGGKLKANSNGSIAVVQAEPDLALKMQKISDNSMAERINQFLHQQHRKSGYESSLEKVLFTIPQPMYLDASGREFWQNIFYQIQVDENIHSHDGRKNILQLVLFNSSDHSFPLWADPSIKFEADVSPAIFNGKSAGDQLGFSVSSAGDFNGDGKDDVIVGVPFADTNGISSGSAFIFFGGKPGTLNNPNTQADVVLHGMRGFDQFGYSVSSAGDFNGDGIGDVIVGSWGTDTHGTNSGSAYLYFGRATPDTLLTPDLVFEGSGAYKYFGFSVSSAGDFNGDGLDDVVIGSRLDSSNGTFAGSVSVFPGRTNGTSTTSIWTVYGKNRKDQLGFSVSSAGDFNGDGKDDIIVGAPYEDNNGFSSGSAYVFFGGKSGLTNDPDLAADVLIRGQAPGDQLGRSVASAGDFNGDGLDDVIVGIPFGDQPGLQNVGSAVIFYGDTNPVTQPDLLLLGQSAGDLFGGSVASVGDYNGDGKDDVVVGAVSDEHPVTGASNAFIYFGGTSVSVIDSPDLFSNVVLHGASFVDVFGGSVASAGDFNGDGLDDVIIGAPYHDPNGLSSGSAFVSYGRYDGPYNAMQGWSSQDEFGYSVASAGDFNGDGLDDVIIGAYKDSSLFPSVGSAYIFLGGNSLANPDIVFRGQKAGDWFGYSVSSAGDFNGDGKDDIIIGAPHHDYQGTNSGSAYIFFGNQNGIIVDPNINADIVLHGRNSGDQFGISVSHAGNFNGDAWEDVIVGAWMDDKKDIDAGSASIFFGGVRPDAIADVEFYGQGPQDFFGVSVSSAGDFDGDGKGDVIIGAYYDDNNGSASGTAYIFYGGKTGSFANPDNEADSVFIGKNPNDRFGYSVSSAGDFNGDGKDDVVVGAWGNDNNGTDSGRAYIFFGEKAGTYNDPDTTADLVISGQSPRNRFGFSVSSAGDFNGDGLDDVIIGAFRDDNNGIQSGSAFIFFGGQTGTLNNPDTQADVVLYGRDEKDFFGISVSSAGDFNGDGIDEIIVGAHKDDNNSTGSGSAFIFKRGFQ